MDISPADVKKLREKTGAGIMECKNALASTGGDFAQAEKLLKEKGLAAVEKRSGRATNEGRVFAGIHEPGNQAVLVELASETDFVARNPEFIALGELVAGRALEKGYAEPNDELNALVSDLAAKIRENMSLRRIRLISAGKDEILSRYIHGDGAIGVVVKLRSDKPEALASAELKTLAFDLALHIAASNPLAVDRGGIDPAFLKEQEEIFRKQVEQDEKVQGKPEQVIANILKGKVNKYLAEVCLLDQGFVKDDKVTVAQVLADYGKRLGTQLTVSEYGYFKVGQ
ncbi:MAG: translation elongation factor Ts [Spirochaetaceae bacterium]|jgi:elongation factor Ts|nr:translation elongation factor Ts [Spirochaetaceae bacterium]